MADTDEQLRAECEKIVADNIRYAWGRSLSVLAFSWGDWLDAAEQALAGGDFSEYRWMIEQSEEHRDYLAPVRSTYGMVAA